MDDKKKVETVEPNKDEKIKELDLEQIEDVAGGALKKLMKAPPSNAIK